MLVKIKILTKQYKLKACVRYFYQIFIFSPNDNPAKTMKNVFSSKNLISFSRYSNFCYFFPPFPNFPDSEGQMEVEKFMNVMNWLA